MEEWRVTTITVDLVDWNADPLEVFETMEVEVLSKPVRHYGKWYHKVLNRLTFGLRFIPYYTYEVKPLEQ
jgi:hypothetical protein